MNLSRISYLYIAHPRRYIFASLLILFCGVLLITGHIPVNDGQGWDGRGFTRIIKSLSIGKLPSTDPYRTMRMGGFIPTILMTSTLNLDVAGILKAQTVINVLLLSLSAVAFFDCLLRLGAEVKTALLTVGTLTFSWPFMVMPVFYPVLSDHIALTIACLSCWLWSRKNSSLLIALSAFAPTVMPGLFVVPIVLAAMPLRNTNDSAVAQNARVVRGFEVGFLALFMCGVAAIAYKMSFIEQYIDQYVLQKGRTLPPGAFDWTWPSMAVSLILIVAIAWKTFTLGLVEQFIRNVSFANLGLSTAGAAITHAIIVYYIQVTPGMKGPPLLDFMVMQALILPLAPAVAHFLYFGPVFLVAAFLLCGRTDRLSADATPLHLIFVGFLPILLLGSESRQWLATYPVMVALVGLARVPTPIRILMLAVSLALCLPLVFLAPQTKIAIAAQLDFSSPQWQLYFGRQGPWMTTATYLIGVAGILGFSTCAYLTTRRLSALRSERE